MKRNKKLLVLFLVLAGLMAATFAATKIQPETETEEEAQTVTVFSLEPDQVTALEWEYSEELAFDRGAEGWTYRDSDAFPVEESYLESILSTLSQVESSKTIENIDNWDTYGLEVPICSIRVTTDRTYSLAIGIETSLGGQRYFSIGDGKAYLVDSAILEPFRFGLYDLMEAQFMPQVDQVTAMTVKTPEGGYTLTWQPDSGRAYSDSYVWFWEDKTLDTQLTESLVSMVTGLNLTQCQDYDARDLSQFGLDSPAVSVTVYHGGEEAYTLDMGTTEKGCYVRLPGTNMVYQLEDSILQTLRYTTWAELLPDEVLIMDWDTVEQVGVTLGDRDYTFRRTVETVTDEEGNTTEETRWLLNGEQTGLGPVLTQLTDMASTGYATGITPEGEGEITFRIYRDRETFPELTLGFYAYNSTSCLVILDGDSTVTVSRQAVADLAAAVKTLTKS